MITILYTIESRAPLVLNAPIRNTLNAENFFVTLMSLFISPAHIQLDTVWQYPTGYTHIKGQRFFYWSCLGTEK